jgi:xanthine/CO dehydrogenase XdhC/CoxF family maturation factor
MNVVGLLSFFGERQESGAPMVLVTVYDTRGSTYSKAGAQMLIDQEGRFHGMLSGGCLEGDLALRAARVIETGEPMAVEYDLSQDDDLWGLGVGCDGTMWVLLQRLAADNDYQPFKAIADAMALDRPVKLAAVIESASPAIAPGSAVVVAADQSSAFGVAGKQAAELSSWLHEAGKGCAAVDVGGRSLTLLAAGLEPPHRLLVLGAGLDAEPVVRMACEMGWRCTVVDHRQAYVDSGDFSGADRVLCAPAESLAEVVDFSRFDAAVIMSHHLVSDRTYLRQLADSHVPYVGLLGPAHRRDRLLEDIGEASSRLGSRLHGPAGLDIGGRGPAVIALSIVAEIQSVLARRTA